ncbi:hypothetical protein L596_006540 [Steinernema carpocapsae]|uniref:Uncharacterized protein n=1 Tax=Steinernema carpocapsae TaxID=34508 RepID=A0A4U8V4V9_STECR|nr:hypothetical protein L596_006540 [Steinernema carpocapsae]
MESYHIFLHAVVLAIIAGLLFTSIFRRFSRIERRRNIDGILEGYSEISGTGLTVIPCKQRSSPVIPPTSDSDNINTGNFFPIVQSLAYA